MIFFIPSPPLPPSLSPHCGIAKLRISVKSAEVASSQQKTSEQRQSDVKKTKKEKSIRGHDLSSSVLVRLSGMNENKRRTASSLR
mmetsp:Transcript_52986/g.103649  ORF Transcript_52986/g.103649 Transcript_52986/m.103649 type:complete len:85 (-) Transcript_52986:439-693(-)